MRDSSPKRIVMRIELTESGKKKIESFTDNVGMTQFAVASRLVEWFSLQSDGIKGMVLGNYPSDIEGDIAKLLLAHTTTTAKESSRGQAHSLRK